MKNVTYINAGAGSGKTYKLTMILTKLIKEGKVKPEEVILTTFTTKAANEFKEKAKAFLFDEGMSEEAMQLDHALIGTVHSVCQRMIGKYWFNLGLSPNMGVMAEEDTKYYPLAELI
jgi:uvrD/REP helicase